MFKMVPTRDYLTVSSVTLGFAHQYNDLLLKFQDSQGFHWHPTQDVVHNVVWETAGTTITFVFSLPNSKE